ncbi:MAG TPA: tetratricopeptide repeat protein [Candidatus Cloacimonetes bacterium]|nr:tetratricopeptide repeat protein [Candidatus Cloacimonadota bacterium]
MKKNFFIITFLLIISSIYALTIIKEFEYTAADFEEEKEVRIIALEHLKNLLLEDGGINLQYNIHKEYENVPQELKNLTSKQLAYILSDFCFAKILIDKWDEKVLSLKAEIKIYEDDILDLISDIINDPPKKMELEQAYFESKDLLSQIETLKSDISAIEDEDSKALLLYKYKKLSGQLTAEEWFLKGSISYELEELESKISKFLKKPMKEEFGYDQEFRSKSWANVYSGDYDETIDIENIEPSEIKESTVTTLPNKSISYYEDALILDPDNFFAYNQIGVILLKDFKYDSAIEYFKTALEINPEFPNSHNNLGIAYMKKANYEKAIDCFYEALKYKPQNAIAYNNLGITYMKMFNYNTAIESFLKAVDINPGSASAYFNMGFTYRKMQNYEKAIESFKKAIEIDPHNSDIHFNLGVAYDDIGEDQKAIDSYLKAIFLSPNNAGIYYNLGVSYGNLGNDEMAVQSYLKAIDINPNDAKVYYNLGIAYGNLGKSDKDLEYTKKAAQLGFKPAQDYLKEIDEKWNVD